MPRCVLLLHHTPDGASHHDWMFQPGDDPEELLITFRLDERPDQGAGPWRAERLDDHRPAYLDYQGPLSGQRGHVVRLADADATLWSESPDHFEARCAWNHADTPRHYTAARTPNGAWLVRLLPERR